MSSNSQNDDFPTIRLDEEDRRDYQQKKQSTTAKPSTNSSKPNAPVQAAKTGFPVVATLSLLIALGSSGAAYYLYEQSLKQGVEAAQAEARILELERKLSATDEEMGESTIALQVKVNELSEKTAELWEQMDKLWASAWRRNQKEIADLSARVTSVQNGLQDSITQVARTTNEQKTQVSAMKKQLETQLETQLANLADEMLALNFQLEQLSNEKNSELQTNKNLQEQLAVIEQRNSALSNRITQLENEIKAMATKILTPPPSAPNGPTTP